MNNTNQVTKQDLEQIDQQIRNSINNKSKDNFGLRGHIKVFITDNKTGIKRKVFEDHNAIQAAYAEEIVDALDVTTNFAMDNLFNGNANPPLDGEDGIAIKDNGGLWYEMIMATLVVTGGDVLIVGTFTGVGITVANAADVRLGQNWLNAAPNDFIGVGAGTPYTAFALPSSWSSQAVLNTETLTIEWTISHSTV